MKERLYSEKIVCPDGKIKYIYPKGKSPQMRYYYSDKGKKNELRKRTSEKRQQYLRKYYQKNKEKIITRVLKRYHNKRKGETRCQSI